MRADSVGVIVARFQVPDLHMGHRYLIEYVRVRHKDVLIALGVPRTLTNVRDPLDYETRKAMLSAFYPDISVIPLHDSASDELWSEALDVAIAREFHEKDVILYGSRDSFLSSYSGKHGIHDVPAISCPSGTDIRNGFLKNSRTSLDFRTGVIYATANRPPLSYQTVDTAVIKPETGEVLLGGRAEDGGKLRFIGGFVDVNDVSLERAAKREVIEETSFIEVDEFHYLGSFRIDDWRYRNVPDKIMTAFFAATFIFGAPRPRDDIESLTWVKYANVEDLLVPYHKPLGRRLAQHLAEKR